MLAIADRGHARIADQRDQAREGFCVFSGKLVLGNREPWWWRGKCFSGT